MRGLWRKAVAAVLVASLSCSMTGCEGKKKDGKKETSAPASSTSASPATGKKEGVEASGSGNNKSDVPLMIGCGVFEQNFNPFAAASKEDQMAVDLTQLSLVTVDREGALINHGIAGEERRYNNENYTYQGPADIRVSYQKKKKETAYTIHLRDDLVFSDGEQVTADDVIFTMYALADASYEGMEKFGTLKLKGLEKYRSEEKSGDAIAGIEKINDYKLRVTTKGYDRNDIFALDIPIAPLHFYGEEEKYNYDKNQFGFQKGDISSLIQKKNKPMGAGAYKFIKYESGIIYYEANGKYYKDYPVTAFIQLKEIKESSTEHKIELLQEGDVDIVELGGDNNVVSQILETNSSGKLNGGTVSTRLYDGAHYAYIGLNARTVCVDQKPDSTRSKNLRHALAILLGCNRSELVATRVMGAKVINYPASDTSWSVPQSGDEEYAGSFVTDPEGQVIYNSDMTPEERGAAACKAALKYLKMAGYTVKKGKVVEAPENTSKKFQILVPKDTDSGRSMYSLALQTQELFQQIGLKLAIVDNLSEENIRKRLGKGKHQIWCGFAETEVNGQLYQMFHSPEKKDSEAGSWNYFGISDSDLDEYIEEAEVSPGLKKSIRLYSQSYGKIMEWAVVVPFYQEREISIFSSSRINMETIVPDITTYFGWMDEIQSVEMK